MKDLLEHLTQTRRYETHIANLAQRLDYNDYYKQNLTVQVGMVRDLNPWKEEKYFIFSSFILKLEK